ncbi:hypothetical protein ABW21_db0208929 [Orbilia brochopaga]|nr:hypothetical protein ABW21_db0208929 [Drechslerella brochopaga]
MSKKRKRDSASNADDKAAHGPIKTEPAAHESLTIDKPRRKDKKRRQSQERSDETLPAHVNFASLANLPDTITTGEESEKHDNRVERAERQHHAKAGRDDLGKPATVEESSTRESEKELKKGQNDSGVSTGHLSILSKFNKYRAEILGDTSRDPGTEAGTTTEQLQGLHPLPLPPQAPVPRVDPHSALPVYLSQPTLVTTTQRPPFKSFNLPVRLLERLEDLKITHAFPVQSALLPLLLPTAHQPPSLPRSDLLVSAATGSGKTLSYLLPILASLQNRAIPRIYALIIVPTHELATQVQKTAQSLASGTSLKISTAIGTRSFDAEKEYIIANDTGSTGADVLIATPGRLVEHIRKNTQFTLRHLQWLIVDEADRLLSQSFQDWVDILGAELQKLFDDEGSSRKRAFDIASLGLRPPRCVADKVRKIILSATMTRDVGKLADLKLRRPELIAVDEMGGREIPMEDVNPMDGQNEDRSVDAGARDLNSLPPTLEERCFPIEDPGQKPLVLSKLLLENHISSGILIFTKSNESAARLGRLLQLLLSDPAQKKRKREEPRRWAIAVSTSDKRKKEISANTAKFKSSVIDILISTDLLARGVDLPNAQLIINYDSPRDKNDYIHRVGRTARAGNSGEAWSLVELTERKWWWGIQKIRRGNNQGVSKEFAPPLDGKDVEQYERALDILGKEVRGL